MGCVERQNTEVMMTENDGDDKLRADSALNGAVDKRPNPAMAVEPPSELKSNQQIKHSRNSSAEKESESDKSDVDSGSDSEGEESVGDLPVVAPQKGP